METLQLVPDHIFILVKRNAPEAELLRDSGFFISDLINKHPESGAGGKSIYFQNFFLELIWIENEEVYSRNIGTLYKDQGLGSLYLNRGIILMSGSQDKNNPTLIPKNYFGNWVKQGSAVRAAKADKNTPLYFIIPGELAYRRDDQAKRLIKPLTNHNNGIGSLSRMTIHYGSRKLSKAEMFIKSSGGIEFCKGRKDYLELEFDSNKNDKVIDLVSELALFIKY